MTFVFNPFTGNFDNIWSLSYLTTNFLYKPGRIGGQIVYGGTSSGDDLVFYSNNSKDGNIKLGDNLVFNEANSSLYINGYAGIGTAPNPIYKLAVDANGSTVGTTFLASNLYSGSGQESYAGYGLAYNASSHLNARATALRFQGVDYNGSKTSGTVTTNGGWLSARDDTSRTYQAGASHSLRAGYFTVDSASGNWSANPSVVTYNFLGGLAPTGFGSNHTHYNIYSSQGQNYLGGQLIVGNTIKATAIGLGTASPDSINFPLYIKKSGTVGVKFEVDGAQNAGYALLYLVRNSTDIGYYGLGSLYNDDIQFATYAGTGAGLRFVTLSVVRALMSGVTGNHYLGLNNTKVGVGYAEDATLSEQFNVNGDSLFNGDISVEKRMIRSKSVYTGTDTTDDVYLHICDSAGAFTLTVTDGADDGEEMKIINRGAGTVTLSGKISSITTTSTLISGETIVLNWDNSDDEWQ